MTDETIRANNAAKLEAAKKALGKFWLGHPDAIPPRKRKAFEREMNKERQKMASKFLRQA